jgi:ferrous iron transport protein B
MKEEGVPLSTLKEGDAAYVHALTGGNAFVSRLASMGIAQATRLKVFRHGGGGPIIVQVGDGRVALGTGEADKILVHVIPGPPEEPPPEKEESRRLLVALAGQPNIGKSTIFNILTGLSQHVGNWPGKTVEKKEGIHRSGEVEMRIVDLPGTYSLTACSEEEKVARDFIIHESPDVIVLLVNAAALERSLYLLTEVLLLGPPVVIALNMLDVAEDQGISIDTKALQDSLGIPVVPMVAVKNRGVRELVTKVIALQKGEVPYHPWRLQGPSRHLPGDRRSGEQALSRVTPRKHLRVQCPVGGHQADGGGPGDHPPCGGGDPHRHPEPDPDAPDPA